MIKNVLRRQPGQLQELIGLHHLEESAQADVLRAHAGHGHIDVLLEDEERVDARRRNLETFDNFIGIRSLELDVTDQSPISVLERGRQVSEPNDIGLAEEKNSDSIVEVPAVEKGVDVRVFDAFDHSPRKLSSNKFDDFDRRELRVFVVDDFAVEKQDQMRKFFDRDFSGKLKFNKKISH